MPQPDSYGLPANASVTYGSAGFPEWVYDLADYFGVTASTYPGHQEGQRAEAGFAPNPQRLNRGIDWTGPVANMQRLAEYLLTVKGSMEQVIWENPNTGQRVGVAGGDDVTHAAYYEADYSGHRDHVHTRQSRPIPLPQAAVPSNRPSFTETPLWSNNNQSRNGAKIDLFLLHTQEGGDGDAVGLARWMAGNGVSYHYTVSTGRPTVTVCDVVDTDLASWSVLAANNRSINLCFAGSKASWSRKQWLDNTNAIEVAAYLAVQDCRKYGIPTTVIAPPYAAGRAGITDHNYVTTVLREGTHTDVGPGFPWDVFSAAVTKYASPTTIPTQPPQEGFLMALSDAEQREVLELLRQQASYRRVSRSPLRHVGEREVETVAGFAWNTDGSVHVLLVNLLARLGDPDALALLREVASLDSNVHPDRSHDRLLAQAILNDIAGVATRGSTGSTGVVPGAVAVEPVPVAAVIPQPVVEPAPVAPVAAPAVTVTPPHQGDGVRSAASTLGTEIANLRDVLNQFTQELRS